MELMSCAHLFPGCGLRIRLLSTAAIPPGFLLAASCTPPVAYLRDQRSACWYLATSAKTTIEDFDISPAA